jgi:hypothetical protein
VLTRTILLAAVLAAATAHADDSVEAQAKARFEEGRAAFDQGDYDRAVKKFEEAYRLKPHPDVLINIATSYERIYNPTEARKSYELYLKESSATSPLRELAEKRLKVLRQLPGSIVVSANKVGADIDLRGEGVLPGGAHVPLEGDGGALHLRGRTPERFEELPPGSYHIRVSLPDHDGVEVEVTLAPGEAHVENVHLEHQVESLTIFSTPDRARVFLDDREVGITPFSRQVEVGRGRRLRLEVKDFPDHDQTFDLAAHRPLRLDVAFKRPPHSGRTELVLASMLYGGAAASALSLALKGDTRLTIGVGLAIFVPTTVAGVGLGFLAAWALTDDYMKVGHSSIIIGGTLWGAILGASLSLGLDLTLRDSVAVSLLGSGLGLGAGVLTAWLNDTSPGDAAIVNSGAMWGAVSAALLNESLYYGSPSHDQTLGWFSLGGTGLGLIAGALFARGFEVSREHVAIVDMSGALGLVLGYGIGYAAGTNHNSSSLICAYGDCVSGARYSLGGMAIGLLVAGILTRHYKRDLPFREAVLSHGHEGWALGVPRLGYQMARAPEGVDRRVTLELLQGTF